MTARQGRPAVGLDGLRLRRTVKAADSSALSAATVAPVADSAEASRAGPDVQAAGPGGAAVLQRDEEPVGLLSSSTRRCLRGPSRSAWLAQLEANRPGVAELASSFKPPARPRPSCAKGGHGVRTPPALVQRLQAWGATRSASSGPAQPLSGPASHYRPPPRERLPPPLGESLLSLVVFQIALVLPRFTCRGGVCDEEVAVVDDPPVRKKKSEAASDVLAIHVGVGHDDLTRFTELGTRRLASIRTPGPNQHRISWDESILSAVHAAFGIFPAAAESVNRGPSPALAEPRRIPSR